MNIPGVWARKDPDPSSSPLLLLLDTAHNFDFLAVQACHACLPSLPWARLAWGACWLRSWFLWKKGDGDKQKKGKKTQKQTKKRAADCTLKKDSSSRPTVQVLDLCSSIKIWRQMKGNKDDEDDSWIMYNLTAKQWCGHKNIKKKHLEEPWFLLIKCYFSCMDLCNFPPVLHRSSNNQHTVLYSSTIGNLSCSWASDSLILCSWLSIKINKRIQKSTFFS